MLLTHDALLSRAAEFLKGRTPVLILAATREAADNLARRAAGSATFGVYRHALRDLVLELSEGPMLDRGLFPVSRIAREALAAAVTARCRTRLQYLTPVVDFPGFPRALARTLEELRLNRVEPAKLRDLGRRSAPDLAELLECYEEMLNEQRYADHATRCKLAVEAVPQRSLVLLTLDLRHRLEQQLVDALKAAAPACLELHASRSADAAGDGPSPRTRLHSLQQHVLTGAPAPALPPDDTVAVFSASGEALEAVEIARRILRLAADHGTPFDEIAILARAGDRQQPLLQEALKRASIPAWYTRGVRRPDPAGRAFVALLQCAAEDYSAARFAEYLSFGQMPAAKEGEIRRTSRWERLLARATVISGLDRWNRRLEACAAQTEDPEELGAIESLRGLALPVIRELAELPKQAPWGEWIDKLTPLARRTLDRPQPVFEVLAELEPMRDAGPVSLDAVLTALTPELTTWREDDDRPRYGRVFVGRPEEAAGIGFRVVFLPGLNEGVFPKPVREDPLLLDSQRAELGLPTVPDDTRLLETAVAAAAERLTLSWSRVDLTTGRERVPSFYAFELAESAGWGAIEVAAFLGEARSATEASLAWPAPASADDAINAAEYDLASLKDASDTGAAAWLGEANGHLFRALTARRSRWSKEWTHCDGLLHTNVHVGLEMEKEYSLTARAYPPTRLEQHARCPYRFYLQSVLKLREPDRPEALHRIPPGIRGDLYHEVQQRFYSALSEEGALPLTNLESALQRLDATLDEVAEKYKEKYAPAIPVVWESDLARLRADLRAWIHYVNKRDKEWTPRYFEYEDQDVKLPSGHRLNVRIDLIEQHANGSWRVTDHKTGRRPDERELKDKLNSGELLQPYLYSVAASQSLSIPVRDARLFYSTLRGLFKEYPVKPDRTMVERVLNRIDESIRGAELPAKPRKDACRHCEYLSICGPYEEQRVLEKGGA